MMLRESTKPVDMTGSGIGGGLGGAKAADGLIQVLCPCVGDDVYVGLQGVRGWAGMLYSANGNSVNLGCKFLKAVCIPNHF